MRVIYWQFLSKKESIDLAANLAEARALRMDVNKLTEQVRALLRESEQTAKGWQTLFKSAKAKKGRK